MPTLGIWGDVRGDRKPATYFWPYTKIMQKDNPAINSGQKHENEQSLRA